MGADKSDKKEQVNFRISKSARDKVKLILEQLHLSETQMINLIYQDIALNEKIPVSLTYKPKKKFIDSIDEIQSKPENKKAVKKFLEDSNINRDDFETEDKFLEYIGNLIS
jgi:antitoxin component of RelBE/YafQ-DinJ toxin-antitoxin module